MAKKQLREQRKINELGTREAKCQICGEEDIFSMATEKVKATKSILEKHHLLGKHEGEEIIVCLNCHARLTDEQLDYPEGVMADNRTEEMKAVHYFLAVGSILVVLAGLCYKHAMTLYNFVKNNQGVSS
jgi:hypothetical protein